MTNPIGSTASSPGAKATSVLGSARQTLRAMAEAATRPQGESAAAAEEKAADAPPHVKSRQGRTLDRYA